MKVGSVIKIVSTRHQLNSKAFHDQGWTGLI